MSSKPVHPRSSPKAFWSILKTFLNNKKYHVSHIFIMKINLLLILKAKLKFLTLFNELLSSMNFSKKDIMHMIQNLHLSKAHEHEQLYASYICIYVVIRFVKCSKLFLNNV